jgi:PmbA protein
MDFIDAILDRAKKRADSAEVFYARSETTACAWNADKLKLAEGKESMGIALRVLIGGRIGFFATNKVGDPARIVDTACELAPFGFEFAGVFPAIYEPANADFFHQPTSEVGAERLIETGTAMVETAKSAQGDALFEAKLDRAVVSITMANTHGARTEFRKTGFSGILFGSITKEGDVLNLYEFDHANHLDDQPRRLAETVARKFKDASRIVSLPSGAYPCILMPKAAGVFLPIKNALNARSVLKDLSPFKDRIGEQVFDARVFLVDDGLHEETPGSQPIDDEGVTGQRTVLVEAGVLAGFIHDLHTAYKMGLRPTGNGTRMGLSAAPRAGFTTLSFLPGTRTLDEMIAGIDKGVIVDQIMGAHQASPFSGDFSINIDLGFVVEKGRIVGRFKNGMLAGNLFKMLKDQLVEIGSEAQYTGVLIPPLLLDGMTVATG